MDQRCTGTVNMKLKRMLNNMTLLLQRGVRRHSITDVSRHCTTEYSHGFIQPYGLLPSPPICSPLDISEQKCTSYINYLVSGTCPCPSLTRVRYIIVQCLLPLVSLLLLSAQTQDTSAVLRIIAIEWIPLCRWWRRLWSVGGSHNKKLVKL